MEKENNKLSRRKFLRLAAISALLAGLQGSTKPNKDNINNEVENSQTTERTTSTSPKILADEEVEFLRKILEQKIKVLPEIDTNQEKQPTATSLEYRNLEMYNEVYDGTYLEELSRQLDLEYSPSISEINPAIKNIIHGVAFDFSKTPEILEARKIPDLHERVLKIITILAPCTKEELKTRKILIQRDLIELGLDEVEEELKRSIRNMLKDSKELNIMKNPKRELLEEKLKILKSIRKKYREFEKKSEILLSIASYAYGNPAWNDEHINFCNLYASLLIDALGLGHRAGHRVDSNGNIVKNGGQELNAGGMFRWFRNHGERHGWKNITNLTYGEKVKLLEEGYIFYGSSLEHNYIISGIRINGRIRPFLTQATENHTLNLFNDFSESATSYKGIPPSQSNLNLAPPEKLLMGENDTYQLFAIHIDDSKNPPIRF